MTDVVTLAPEHETALRRFFDEMPDEDVTSVKEDVRSPDMVGAAVVDKRASRWVVLQDGDVAAYASLIPGVGLSAHVGELRLVVSHRHRRKGIGKTVARTALRSALSEGLSKVVVEVPAEQEATAEVFRRLGFQGEALLRDHVRDRSGALRDLLVLAHFAEENSSIYSGLGLDQPH